MKNLSAPAPSISPGDQFTWNGIECTVIVPYEMSVLCVRTGSSSGKFGVPINDAIKAKIEKAYIDAGEKPPFIVSMKETEPPLFKISFYEYDPFSGYEMVFEECIPSSGMKLNFKSRSCPPNEIHTEKFTQEHLERLFKKI